MNVQSLDVLYNFEFEEDITDKKESFIERLEELESLAKRLQRVVHEEATISKGELIEQITNSIDEYVNYSQLYYDATKNSMVTTNATYNKLINKIKAHNITIHYEKLR